MIMSERPLESLERLFLAWDPKYSTNRTAGTTSAALCQNPWHSKSHVYNAEAEAVAGAMEVPEEVKGSRVEFWVETGERGRGRGASVYLILGLNFGI